MISKLNSVGKCVCMFVGQGDCRVTVNGLEQKVRAYRSLFPKACV